MANEMSALYDKLEELEEHNAVLLASDAGELMERNARQAGVIKELLAENNALRVTNDAALNSGIPSAPETSNNRKRKRDDDAQSVAEHPLDHANSKAADETDDTDQSKDAGMQVRKKLKLTATFNEVAPSKTPPSEDQSIEVQDLRTEVGRLRAIVRHQDEALAAQSKAGEPSKAHFGSEAKHIDALLEEIQRRRIMERKYAERTDELVHKTRRHIAQAAGLDPNAIHELGANDENVEEGVELSQLSASSVSSGQKENTAPAPAREQCDDKGKDEAHAISVHSGSIFEDESARSLQSGRPKEPETCFAPVRPHLPKDPRVPGKRKPLGELPVEEFCLRHKWTTKDVQDMLVEIVELEEKLGRKGSGGARGDV